MDPHLKDAFGRSETKRITGTSMLSTVRLKAIMGALEGLPEGGDTAEIGCNAGGTTRLIAQRNGGRRHWAVDTFVGLVDAEPRDGLKNGDFAGTSFQQARVMLADLGNIRMVQGYFPACAPPEMLAARYAFVHLDVDTNRSIRDCFAFFETRMLPGGVIALDDVIGRGTRGAKLAWQGMLPKASGWRVIAENDPQAIVRFD